VPKYYAHSNFQTERNEFGQPTKVVAPGEEVTASKLGVSEAEFELLLEGGSVRTDPYPNVDNQTSPLDYYRQLESKEVVSEEDLLTEEEMKVLAEYRESQVTEEEKATEEASKGLPPKSSK
jgi:hypothetical protein